MPLDVLEADLVALAQNGVRGAAPRRLDARGLKFDVIASVLQRDDPLRRSHLQRRWHSQAMPHGNVKRTSLSPFALSRR